MYSSLPISSSLHAHLWQSYSDRPVLYFSPKVLHESYRRFLLGFDGLVTYAVKANASSLVLDNLASAGLTTFDMASPAEMQIVRAALPMILAKNSALVQNRWSRFCAVSNSVV